MRGTPYARSHARPMPQAEAWWDRIPVRGAATRALHADWLTPARLLLLSFAALIGVGTLGLRTLPGLYTGAGLTWTDALFTATSAVCVTGLIVVDTATHFTPLGQAYLLVLIQLGGLGILTFATVVILAMGRRVPLRHRAVAAQGADVVPDIDFRRVLRGVILFTFLFEGVGALLLFAASATRLGVLRALGASVFHAVSAFCNAGFSTFTDSLVGFRSSPVVLGIVMVLVVVGGLGFLTLVELRTFMPRKSGPLRRRISLHTRIVLWTTGGLLLVGALAFATLEWEGALGDMSAGHRIVNALFMSVTARTAGFNTVDYADVTTGTSMVTMILMAIGGSPGSTAGGMKTTTFAVLLLAVWSRLRARHEVAVGGRAVNQDAIQRALVLWVAGSVLLSSSILVLSLVEPVASEGGFLAVLFEATSAFNTVGLSMGATSDLAAPAKDVLVALMYLGRVGPLATAAALVPVTNGGRDVVKHAPEDLVVG